MNFGVPPWQWKPFGSSHGSSDGSPTARQPDSFKVIPQILGPTWELMDTLPCNSVDIYIYYIILYYIIYTYTHIHICIIIYIYIPHIYSSWYGAFQLVMGIALYRRMFFFLGTSHALNGWWLGVPSSNSGNIETSDLGRSAGPRRCSNVLDPSEPESTGIRWPRYPKKRLVSIISTIIELCVITKKNIQ